MADNTNTVTIEIECPSCNGTGIYRDKAQKKGVGLICIPCKGTGMTSFTYTPFTRLKERNDIVTVYRSAGTNMLTGDGPTGRSITYKKFLTGKMPK